MIKTQIRRIAAGIFVGAMPLLAVASGNGFAVFVDSASFANARAEVEQYVSSVKDCGLDPSTIVLTPDVTPDSIRSIVRSMAGKPSGAIEGMVFIGDVPIAMVFDAQHLSSAFKPVQNYDKRPERSSCPTDRFYDDLSLDFKFMKRDEKKPLLYYYTLTADGAQASAPKLYSGRIKSMDFYGRDKYENLRRYLRKVVEIKKRREPFRNMLMFSGQGYNSESVMSRIDEIDALRESFPMLRDQQNAFTYIDHKNSPFVKYPVMGQLQRPDMSLALLHHHGSPVNEYMNRYPDPRSVQDQLGEAKRYFRSKIRSGVAKGQPLDTVVARYCRDFNVPDWWFKDVLSPESVKADSIYDDKVDLHIYDFGPFVPNSRVVMLDACYNGAYNNDEYIAGAYIFGDGDCVAAIANSVNSLQDKWCDKNIGLFALGMPLGKFVQHNPYLESHVIGDPTFAFVSPRKDIDAKALVDGKLSDKKLRRLLESDENAAVRAAALDALAARGAIDNAGILKVFRNSNSATVRFHALWLLSEHRNPEFVEAIKVGLADSHEIIRRFSAIFAGKNGSAELVPALIAAYSNRFIGERAYFQLQMAMPMFSSEALLTELERQRPYRYEVNEDEQMDKARNLIGSRYSDASFSEDFAALSAEKPNAKEIKSLLRRLRNSNLHPRVDELLGFVATTDDDELRLVAIEALGWFTRSYRADDIAAAMEKVAADSKMSEKSRNEARKTVARIRTTDLR